MNFVCKDCIKSFKTKFNLERHSSSCKKKPIISEFKCSTCFKLYTTKYTLERHKISCKNKNKDENKDENKDKNKDENKDEDKDKIKDEKIKLLELQLEIEKLKNKKNKIVNNTTNITNTINNFYGMEPLDLSQNRFDSIAEVSYTYENYIKARLVPEIILKFLSNDKDKIVALLTDYNRMKIKCLNQNLEVEIHDPQSFIDFCKKSKPIISRREEYDNKAYELGLILDAQKEALVRTDLKTMTSSLKSHRKKFLQKKKKDIEQNLIKE